MSKFIMLVGLPGSGKSTWRESNGSGYTILSTDDMVEDIAKEEGKTYSEVFGEISMKDLNRKMFDKFDLAVENGEDIIVDRTNLTPKGRASFLAKLPETYTKKAIIFKVDGQELANRLEKRAEETGKMIPTEVILSMINSYIEPTLQEFDEIDYA